MGSLNSNFVAVDLSPCSAAALKAARRIADCHRASLRAVHVVAIPSFEPAPHPLFPFPQPTQADLVSDARESWTRFLADSGVPTDVMCDIEVGRPRDAILELVARARAELLDLGAHSVHDAYKGVGPTAAACMQRAKTRVLLVREDHDAGPFRNIVACVDFTETSKLGLQEAIRTAAEDGAALSVLHVYDDPWHGLRPPLGIQVNMPDFTAQFRRRVEDRLREFCTPFAHELSALKAAYQCVESQWRGGGYGHAIVRVVKEQRWDLVLLGTRDRWNIRDMVFGSTAERVVREARCSILAVKPELAS
ncbi:MAG: universal stress protein [Phycisphaerales bacterium]|jgi:nucleotide-binding universal stress UspA family protein|nr:universal stress protein [Phycisphaerales bacterium]